MDRAQAVPQYTGVGPYAPQAGDATRRPKLVEIADEASLIAGRLKEAAALARLIADRVLGPEMGPDENPAQAAPPEPDAFVHRMSGRQGEACEALGALERQLERLEREVGD